MLRDDRRHQQEMRQRRTGDHHDKGEHASRDQDEGEGQELGAPVERAPADPARGLAPPSAVLIRHEFRVSCSGILFSAGAEAGCF